jgi:hypothetical protein
MSDLRMRVDQAVERRLERLGFTKARDGVFLREISPGVSGWIGVGLASQKRGGEVDADPMVGVRYEPVEQLVPSSAPHDATVFRPLYELLPGSGYRTWSFSQDGVEEQADALADTVEEAAVPFMDSLASPNAIKEALTSWAFADIRRRRLPAFRLVEGDEAGARDEVDRQKAILEDEGDRAMLEEYERFSRELLASPRT